MSRTVLLDTGVLGGVLSSNETESQKWKKAIRSMLEPFPGAKITVSTPAWFEFAQWSLESYKQVFQRVQTDTCNGLYEFAGHTIPNKILLEAALYKCLVRSKQNSQERDTNKKRNKDTISMSDALIATYCLKYNYLLFTMNMKDFPQKFFEIEQIQLSPKSTDFQRDFIALLSPKIEKWNEAKRKNL